MTDRLDAHWPDALESAAARCPTAARIAAAQDQGRQLADALCAVLATGDELVSRIDGYLARAASRRIDAQGARAILAWRAASDRLLFLMAQEGI